jgi:predicted nucleotidyltransferase
MEQVPGVNPDLLQEIVRRIVEVAQPERIILFGSAARGEVGPHSDVDLLIVKSGAHRGKLTEEIYLHLFGVGVAVDAIAVTPEDLRGQPGTGDPASPGRREGGL